MSGVLSRKRLQLIGPWFRECTQDLSRKFHEVSYFYSFFFSLTMKTVNDSSSKGNVIIIVGFMEKLPYTPIFFLISHMPLRSTYLGVFLLNIVFVIILLLIMPPHLHLPSFKSLILGIEDNGIQDYFGHPC